MSEGKAQTHPLHHQLLMTYALCNCRTHGYYRKFNPEMQHSENERYTIHVQNALSCIHVQFLHDAMRSLTISQQLQLQK